MSGNGGDNAHNNAFSGGKNPGIGNSGSGSNSGTSGNGGQGSQGGRTQNINGFSVNPNNSAQVNAAKRGDAAGVFSAGGSIAITQGADRPSGKGSGGNGGNGGSSGSQTGSNNSQNQSAGNNAGSTLSTWDRTAKYYSDNDKVSRKALKNLYEKAVRDGVMPKAARGNLRESVQKMLDEDKRMDAQEALQKASELITDMGEKIGIYLGEKYKEVAREIAGDIKNFQGKTIRNYNDAMASLNKIITNPGMKINQADKDALVNAWKSMNANDMANKLGNLSKAFKAGDVAIKIEKVREKSIEGYNTGNWGPLMLEVESWYLSGVAAGVAMGILAAIAPIVATTVGLPVTALTIAGIIGIGYLASFIDDKMVDKINNELIKPAH